MIDRLKNRYFKLFSNHKELRTFIRFVIVGACAATIHYGIYFILQWGGINLNIAYSAGYIISFFINYVATNKITFGTRPNWKNFMGFAGSHGINFVLHILLFNVLIRLGCNQLIAPPVVMLVAMFVQYAILHFVFSSKPKI